MEISKKLEKLKKMTQEHGLVWETTRTNECTIP